MNKQCSCDKGAEWTYWKSTCPVHGEQPEQGVTTECKFINGHPNLYCITHKRPHGIGQPEQGKGGEINTEVPTNGEQVQTWEERLKEYFVTTDWISAGIKEYDTHRYEKVKDFIAKEKEKSYEQGIKRGIEVLQRNNEELGKLKPNRYKEKAKSYEKSISDITIAIYNSNDVGFVIMAAKYLGNVLDKEKLTEKCQDCGTTDPANGWYPMTYIGTDKGGGLLCNDCDKKRRKRTEK